MNAKRALIVTVAFIFALLLNAYLFVHMLWNASIHKLGKTSVAHNECEDGSATEQGKKVNPNKMLFISCGGFLE